MSYTQLALLAVTLAVAADLAVLRTRLLTRSSFWLAYAVILFFQLLTNGWLTGRGIVRYEADTVLGGAHARFLGSGRVAYAPVEDLFFGFALVLWTLGVWVRLGRPATGAAPQDRRARR
jgi:lycopene cyclase domain-containing protein